MNLVNTRTPNLLQRGRRHGTKPMGIASMCSVSYSHCCVSDGMFRRAKTARWMSDQSESEEEPSDDSEQDDREETPVKASSAHEDGLSGQESDEEDANEKKTERSRKPSRKAGTRAKVCCFLCALSRLISFS